MYGVCMYACVHIGVHCWQDGVSLRGSNTDGNPFVWVCRMKPLVWVCHVLYYFTIETRETSQRSPICRSVHMYVSGCICMRVCGWDWVSYMDNEGLQRWKKKRVQDRYSEMDACD